MRNKSTFIFALILLITLGGCVGSNSDSETPEPISTSPSATNEGSSNQPKNNQTPSVDPKTPTPSTSKPSESKPTKDSTASTSSSTTPSSASSIPPTAPPQETSIPKLSPEEEKLISKITTEVKQEADFVTQNSGITTVNRILVAQQAMWLISGSFSTDFKALEPNLPTETDEYRFQITQGDPTKAVVKAIAKNDKLLSFTGTTVAIADRLPQSGICQTKLPSQTAPTPPKIEQGKVQCGNDAVPVESFTP